MAGIVCKQCGYENPEGSSICEICAEELGGTPVQPGMPQGNAMTSNAPSCGASVVGVVAHGVGTQPGGVFVMGQQPANPAATVGQVTAAVPGDNKEYFVLCPESQTKTILPHGKVTRFFCEGCKKEHEIDDFLWTIESREKEASSAAGTTCEQATPAAVKGDNLWLEEINTHFRIDIDKTGGTLGRYGTFGAAFFQSRNMLTVSGEHCMITYEFGNWVLRHMSRTNQTIYNNMVLGANEPNLLEDGKLLVLANAVTFVVRIG